MSHMAGHASTAGVWPAMSTNVVHMAQRCLVEMGHAARRGEIASPLKVDAALNTLFHQQHHSIQF